MRAKFLIYPLMLLAATLVSCSSQFKVIRGDTGEVGVSPSGPSTSPSVAPSTEIPKTRNKAARRLLEEAYSWLGTPYQWGGETKDGADCSGFVMMVYKNALGISLPRTSYDQGDFCREIRMDQLELGDLVFFTGNSDRVGHVGIYVGDGCMIHSSSSRGVVVDCLDMKYFVDHYHHSGRVDAFHKMKK